MESLIEKAKKIKLLILDVDGVLTTGVIYYISQGTHMKGFHIHDGFGIKLLQKAGIEVALISGHQSDVVMQRAKDLAIEHIYLGNMQKLPAYEELKHKLSLQDNEIAYMGDDWYDLPLLRRAGLAMTVPQAPDIVKEHAHFTTRLKAGKGAVREACEFILKAQNKYQQVLDPYLL